ncbi:MAG: universal stress protein [Chloroflexota bacterium]
MYSRILVPLDGSRLAESVLPVVSTVAAAWNSTVILVHILERGAPSEVHGERHLRSPAEATEYLQTVAGTLRSKQVTVELHCHDAPEGDVAKSIVAHAEEHRANLILLCTHGSGRVKHILSGSIAQQVLHRGSIPVLLVRPEIMEKRETFSAQIILVPLDATAAAEVALAPATEIAKSLGARLHLVMVVPTGDSARSERPAATLLPTAVSAALELEEQHAHDYLEDLAGSIRGPALTVTTEVRRGSTASALAEEAAEPGIDLVVVATHGKAGLQAIWAGSVTAQLLTRTHAPVLLLRRVED